MKKEIAIRVESFDPKKIDLFLSKLNELCNEKKVKITHHISLPTTKKIYTVLRSPHIDKKSREQFEMRRYSKLVKVVNLKESENIHFMDLLKNLLFAGVALKIRLISYESL